MALDKAFSLLPAPGRAVRIDLAGLRDVLDAAGGRPCVVLVSGGAVSLLGAAHPGGGLPSQPRSQDGAVAFVLPAMSPDRAWHALEQSHRATSDPYDALAQSGIVTLSPVVEHGAGLLLSGGSLSTVTLATGGDELLVTKAISGSAHSGGPDGIVRHRAEARFLRRATECGISAFPRLRNLSDSGDSLTFSTDFFPAHTAAELVFQGRMSGEELGETVVAVYEVLRRDVYGLPVEAWRGAKPARDYVQTIRRRASAMATMTGPQFGAVFRHVVEAEHVVVNGLPCVPHSRLLTNVETDLMWRDVLRPRGPARVCHGDLILEDILVRDVTTRDFRLIDPNPYNGHPLFDVAKTLLSLLIGYEFFYYDQFDLEVDQRSGSTSVDIRIRVHRDDCLREYAIATKVFWDYLQSGLRDVFDMTSEVLGRQLRMAAALHALAIPWFHLIHHRQENRAIAFLAAGLYHATLASGGQTPTSWDDAWLACG